MSINIGIIGLGKVGKQRFMLFRDISKVDSISFFDPTIKNFKGINSASNVSTLFSDKNIDAIVICTPNKQKIELIEIPNKNGITDISFIVDYKKNMAAIIIQSPNTYGLIEDLQNTKKYLDDSMALLIASCDPLALSVLKSPGECGADIYVGEGQPLGNYMNFGGPLLGLMAVRSKYKRQIPGRIIGKTIDKNNEDGFVLTLQTREQHIRREKATSNICTNQSLLALRATIYLSLLGKKGLPYIANLCRNKAQYAAKKISELNNYSLPYSNRFIKEFVIKTTHPALEVIQHCSDKGLIINGINDDDKNSLLLIAITEKRTQEEIDLLVHCLGDFN